MSSRRYFSKPYRWIIADPLSRADVPEPTHTTEQCASGTVLASAAGPCKDNWCLPFGASQVQMT